MAEVTIRDVARLSGYSIKTVSRVLNKQPTVAKDIREKVEAVVAKLNYHPNVWARSLRSSRSHLIALFSEDPTIAYVSRIQLAATATCRKEGYHLVSEAMPSSERYTTRAIKDVVNEIHLDGALLTPPICDNPAMLKALAANGLPFVRVSPSTNLDTGSYVYIDDRKVAYDMTRYLFDLGHREIAFVGGPRSHAAAGNRLAGFEDALRDCGIAVHKDWILDGQFDVQSGMIAGESLFSGRKWPTAVLGSNDETAVGLMAAAYRKGASIPRDVSIVGIDDAPIASSFWPKLTTMRQPVVDLGRAATKILIEEIESPRARRVEKLECEIVVRDSAGAPPARAPAKSRAQATGRR